MALSLFILPMIASTSFTFGESIDTQTESELLNLILDNKEYCTQVIEEEKIYLKPDQIFPTEDGIFLRINQFDLVKISPVFSDELGCYIEIDKE